MPRDAAGAHDDGRFPSFNSICIPRRGRVCWMDEHRHTHTHSHTRTVVAAMISNADPGQTGLVQWDCQWLVDRWGKGHVMISGPAALQFSWRRQIQGGGGGREAWGQPTASDSTCVSGLAALWEKRSQDPVSALLAVRRSLAFSSIGSVQAQLHV